MPIPVFTPTFPSMPSARAMASAHLLGDERVRPVGASRGKFCKSDQTTQSFKGKKEIIIYAWDPHITCVRWNGETGDTFVCRYEAGLTIIVLNGISHADRLTCQLILRKYKYIDRFIDHALQSASGKNPIRYPFEQMIRRQKIWDSKHRRFWEFVRWFRYQTVQG